MTAVDPAFATGWGKAPAHVPVVAGELHLWRALRTTARGASLSAPERDRADAYRFEADRVRFVARRDALRVAVGAHLGTPPDTVVVNQRCPTCGSPGHGPLRVEGGLSVSLSAAGDVSLVAVTSGSVGVDVEQGLSHLDVDAAAGAALSPAELAALPAGPPAARAEAFLRALWTVKEAVLKAGGTGLAADPRAVGVSGDTALDPAGAHWHVHRFDVSPGYVAAVATDAAPARIVRWDVP